MIAGSVLMVFLSGSALLAGADDAMPAPRREANPDASDQARVPAMLDTLIEQAIRYHPSLRARQQERDGMDHAADAARWQRFPTLSVLAEQRAATGGDASQTPTASTIRLEQPLWTGGRLTAGIEAARERQKLASWALEETRWSVALQVIQAWQNAWTALGRLKTQLHLLRELEKLRTMMERRVAQQVSAPVDAQLLQTRLLQAQSDLEANQAMWLTALDNLAQWAGPEAVRPLRLLSADAVELDAVLAASAMPALEALHAAVAQAPSLRRQEALIAATRQDFAQQQAALWPTLYARVERTFTQGGRYGGGNDTNDAFLLGAAYSTDAGLSLRSRLKLAESEIAALESDREALRLQLRQSYGALWQQVQANARRAGQAAAIQAGNVQLYESYTRLFVAGRRSWLELLNILRDQNSADQSYSDLLVQLMADGMRLRLYMNSLPWQSMQASRHEIH